YAAVGGFDATPAEAGLARDHVTGLLLAEGFEMLVDRALAQASRAGSATACFMLRIDQFAELEDRHGKAARDLALRRCAERLRSALREADAVAYLGGGRFGIGLHPVGRLDLEAAVTLAGRLQQAMEEPVALDSARLHLDVAAGFCLLARSPRKSAEALIAAAEAALEEAAAAGPGAIRAYTAEMEGRFRRRHALDTAAIEALAAGQILPWFQPQISTDTGQVTGFEALARWAHPEKGVLAPAEFLPQIEAAGQLARLGELMLHEALSALRRWDEAGLDIPTVAVNVSPAELRDPHLPDKVAWELDRFGLGPDRLCIEVLETVIAASPDDVAARNVNALARLGCRIDLDDFGTGHASIASIRRFDVARLKIDRSFVARCDRDPDQQRMVTAILTMAERLDLATLAEGVESPGEHALLAQLGCGHVQGYGIGRPMPSDQVGAWVSAHRARLERAPLIGRGAG
ncbi:MAG: putative bifunctional diguanylate cyclase/phosphodiesterase, partial [Paracoccaceae bacterium]